MTTICSAGNLETACLQHLLDKGYKIQAETRETQNGVYINKFIATKPGFKFVADDTVTELYGIVMLYETQGDNWGYTESEINPWTQIEDV